MSAHETSFSPVTSVIKWRAEQGDGNPGVMGAENLRGGGGGGWERRGLEAEYPRGREPGERKNKFRNIVQFFHNRKSR